MLRSRQDLPAPGPALRWRPSPRRWPTGVLAALLALSAGCASDPTLPPPALDPDSFRAGDGRPSAEAPPPAVEPPRIVVTAPPENPPPVDITSRAGAPIASERAETTGPAVVIDSKIGDINGHPVWASEFFDANLSERLAARALELPPAQWKEEVQQLIDQRLEGLIDEVLMTDEGLATWTPEMQQAGLATILNIWRNTQKSKNMGSEERANQAARERQTQYYESLDAQARDFKQRLLISLMKDKLDNSINISSADIRRFYYSNLDVFQPPPRASFSMILSDDAEAAAEARWALDEGAPFADVAALPVNAYKSDRAGRMDDKEFRGDYATAELFNPGPLAIASARLTPGQWTGPFDDRGAATFLRLDGIATNHVSLYDAQMVIESWLRDAEFKLKMRQMIDRLKSRSSLTDQDEMNRRLMDFAIAKFLPGQAK
jgi:hypothetical protein